MLNNAEIIELYHNRSYDIIIEKLKINTHRFIGNIDAILMHAVNNSNIELLIDLSDIDDNIYKILKLVINNPILKILLEHTSSMQTRIYDIIMEDPSRILYDQINIQLFNILITYFTSDDIKQIIFNNAIKYDSKEIIDALYEHGYDIKLAFNTILPLITHAEYYKKIHIKLTTYIYLEKYGVDILSYLNELCIEFYDSNDVNGLRFCLEHGIDTDYVLSRIKKFLDIDLIKCLLDYGADLNKIDVCTIGLDIRCFDSNLPVIKYMVENGLDLNSYLFQLIMRAIPQDSPLTVEYFISLGADIHYSDDYLLPYSCWNGKNKIVQLLLDNGANIHIANGTILQFAGISSLQSYPSKSFKIAKMLIKAGVSVVNPIFTLYLYIHVLPNCPMDEELFIYLLDNCIDLNSEFDPDWDIMRQGISAQEIPADILFKYILEPAVYFGSIALVKLFIKYGANPFINNHSPLKLAIMKNKIEIVKFLLDLESVVDPDFEYIVESEIIDLLNQYGVLHKLKKIN